MYIINLPATSNPILAFLYSKKEYKIRVCNKKGISLYFGKDSLKIGESLIKKDTYLNIYPNTIFIYLNR